MPGLLSLCFPNESSHLPTQAQNNATPMDLEIAVAQLRRASTATSLEATDPSGSLRDWLQLNSSLTAQLTYQFGAPPGLIVLGEGLEEGQWWEKRALNADASLYARHIALTINEVPVVLARTVTTPGLGMKALTELRTRPLAELLFEGTAWTRQTVVQYLTLANGSPGRGCTWYNSHLHASLVVQEFFLPSLCALLTQ